MTRAARKHRRLVVVLAALVVLGLAGLWLRDVAGLNVPDGAYDLAEQQAREGSSGHGGGGTLGRYSGWGDCAVFEVLGDSDRAAGSTYYITVIRRDDSWQVGRVSSDDVGFDTDDISTASTCRRVSHSTGDLTNGTPT